MLLEFYCLILLTFTAKLDSSFQSTSSPGFRHRKSFESNQIKTFGSSGGRRSFFRNSNNFHNFPTPPSIEFSWEDTERLANEKYTGVQLLDYQRIYDIPWRFLGREKQFVKLVLDRTLKYYRKE